MVGCPGLSALSLNAFNVGPFGQVAFAEHGQSVKGTQKVAAHDVTVVIQIGVVYPAECINLVEWGYTAYGVLRSEQHCSSQGITFLTCQWITKPHSG